MSRTIDQRVVDMQFNNAQFESGIKDSMKSIENLKKGLNFDESSKSFSNLTRAANSVSLAGIASGVETISSRFSTLGIIGVTALANITNSAINLGKSLIGKVLDPLMEGGKRRALNIEQAKFQFAGLGMDIEATMADASYAVDGTAYSLDAAAKVASQLGASGMRAGEDMRRSLRAVSGVAAMAGSSYEDIGNVFTKVAGQGRLMGDDLLRLSSRGINAAATIAKELNKTEAEVRKMVTDGKISFKIFSDAMDSAFGEHATAANKTFTGSLSNMRSALARIGEKFYTPFHQNLITPLNDLRTVINEVNSSLTPAFNSLANFMGLASGKLSAGIRNLDTGWNQFIKQGIHDTKLFEQTLIDVGRTNGVEVGRFIHNGKTFAQNLKLGWVTADILGESIKKLAVDTKDLTDEQIEQMGYTREQIDTLQKLNASVKDGSVNLDEWAKKLSRASAAKNIIDGFANAVKFLGQVLSPIKNAFAEIFPPATLEQIYKMTVRFKEFTSTFKIGAQVSENLKSTFKGLFAVVDIGVEFFKALGKGVLDLVKSFAPVGSGILEVTGNIGDFLVYLRDVIKQSDIFNQVIGGIVHVLKPVGGAISWITDLISKLFDRFANFDTSKIDTLADRFKPFTGLGEMFTRAFEGLKGVLNTIYPMFGKLSDAAGIAFSAIKDGLASIFSGDDKFLTYAAGGGAIAAIIAALKDLVFNIKLFFSDISLFDNFKRFMGNVNGVLGNLSVSLRNFQETLRAKTLFEIAKAVALLAAAVLVLSTIDPINLAASLGALTVMFVDLMGAMAVFNLISGPGGIGKIAGAASMMIAMSVALLILSAAVKSMSGIAWEDLQHGLAGVVTLIAALSISALILSKSKGKLIKGSVGLIAFATAILILSSAVEKMAGLDFLKMGQGLLAVGVLLGSLVLFFKLANFDGIGPMKGVGILLLAAALNVLAGVVEKFAGMDIIGIGKGLGAIGILLLELGLFTKLTANAKHVLSTAASLVIIGAAMHILAGAVAKMGALSMEEIGKGLLTMGGSLLLITAALKFMPTTAILSATSLVIVGAALNILATALKSMGGMDWSEIGKGLVALAGSLGLIVAAMIFMPTALPGAAALLIVAGALSILAPVLQKLGSMTLAEIGKGLLALAGAFAVIGVAGLLLAPLTPAILGLSLAIGLLGVAILAIGAGVSLFAAGIAALAVAGAAGAAALVAVVSGLLGLIPMALSQIAQGIVAFAEVIIQGAPALAEAAFVLISSLVGGLMRTLPMVVNAVGQLMLGILQKIAEHGPQIASTVLSLIANLLIALGNAIPSLIDAGIKLMVGFINGLADGVRDNTEIIFSAVRNLLSSIIEFSLAALAELAGHIPLIGDKIQAGLTTAKEKVREIIAPESMAEIGANAAQGVADGIESKNAEVSAAGKTVAETGVQGMTEGVSAAPKVGSLFGEDFVTGLLGSQVDASQAGSQVGQGSLDAILGKSSEFSSAGTGLGGTFADALSATSDSSEESGTTATKAAETGIKSNAKEFENAGSDAGEGFTQGLSSWGGRAEQAAMQLGKRVLVALQDSLKIESPSKVMRDEVGRYIVEGIADGIKGNMSAEEAAEKKAQNIVNAFKKALERIDLTSTTDDLEYKLWAALSGDKASASEKLTQDMNLLNRKVTAQQKKLELAQGEYENMLKQFGADNDNTINSYNKYLQEQITMAELSKELAEKQKEGKQTEADRMLEYAKFMSTFGKDMIEKQGMNEEEVKRIARHAAGYDVNDTNYGTTLQENVQTATVKAMGAVNTAYEKSAETTFGGLIGSFNNWGGTYAKSLGDGFVEAFNDVMQKILVALDKLDQTITLKLDSIIERITAAFSMLGGEPTITPVLDLTNIQNGSKEIDNLLANQKGLTLSVTQVKLARIAQNGYTDSAKGIASNSTESATINYTQNNYSPKALSRIDIYRQTRNQLSTLKGMVNA